MKPLLSLLFLLLFTSLSLQAGKLEKVSLQLQWLDQFQFAGYYVAKEKGFYKDAGIDVEIKKFGDGIITLDEVLSKKATYGIGRSNLIIDINEGKEIVLLASIFQSSPSVLLATKESGILSVKDFIGKRVMMTPDASSSVAMRAMMNRSGVSIEKMIRLKHSFDINDLINGQTDLVSSYISNEPYFLKESGVAYTVFDPKDYGFDFYSDILFTSAEEVRDHRQRAVRFTEASLKGWEYAFNHIDETVMLILEKYNTQHKSKEALTFEADALKKLAYYNTRKLGHISRQKIEKTSDFYNVMGLLKNKIDYEEYILEGDKNASIWSREEKTFLTNKKEILYCADANWMPFEEVRDGKHIGISADYLGIIESKIGIPMRLVPTRNWSESMAYAKARKCDILPLAMETPERKEYMDFTKPYLVIPLVIATTADKFFIADLEEVLDKRIGLVKGYAFTELLKLQYPSLDVVEVESVEQGLEKVAEGKLFGFIDNLTTIGYQMQRNYIGTLKIAGRIGQNWELAIAVRNDEPILLHILDKALGEIDEKTKQGILNQWMSIDYDQGFDYALFWKIVGGLTAMSVLLLYRYIMIKRYNRTLSELNRELEKLSTVDALTKLYNRRYLDQNIDLVHTIAKRYDLHYALIFIDIDDFKDINDTHGHKAGDFVLQKIANILLMQSRESDVVGRWGGEEFLIICPQNRKEAALKVAEKIRGVIEKEVVVDGSQVTASFGVAEYRKGDTDRTVLERADKALYQAKKEGKNRVAFV